MPLLAAGLGCLFTAASIGYVRSQGAPARPAPGVALPLAETVLTVNGQSVSNRDFEQELKQTAASETLQRLLRQMVIEQEAARQEIKLSQEEEAELYRIAHRAPSQLRALARRQARSEYLLRSLVLQDVSESTKQRLFRQFGPQLTQYEVSVLLVGTDAEARYASANLAVCSFETLVETMSLDPSKRNRGRVGFLTRSQLQSWLGNEAAEAVVGLQKDSVTPPLHALPGRVILKRGEVRSSYEHLKPAIENLIADSRREELMYRLLREAKVNSPYLMSQPGQQLRPIGSKTPSTPDPKIAALVARSQIGWNSRFSGPLRPTRDKPKKPTMGANLTRGKVQIKPSAIKFKTTAPPLLKGPLNATLTTDTYRLLPDLLQGQAVLRLDKNQNHHADSQEPILVQVTRQGWRPVGNLSEPINRFAMEQDLGYWVDQERYHTEGPLWARKKVVDQAPNGKAEPEEVTLLTLRPRAGFLGERIIELGAEISRDQQGRLFHSEQRAAFRNHAPDPRDMDRLKVYRDSDANWQVPGFAE